jgi:hypothetical protein
MLEQFRPTGTSVIFADGRLQVINDPALTVGRNTITGRKEARIRVGGSRPAFLEAGIYDARGALTRSLFRGMREPGLYTLELGASAGPAYLKTSQSGGQTLSARVDR